jgi:hypothetical protein
MDARHLLNITLKATAPQPLHVITIRYWKTFPCITQRSKRLRHLSCKDKMFRNYLISIETICERVIWEERYTREEYLLTYLFFYYYYLVCEAIGTAATPGLLCQPWVIGKWLWTRRWNVDWQGKPKFSEKTCPSATFVHHKIPHYQTRISTRAAAVGSRWLTAWAMARPYLLTYGAKPFLRSCQLCSHSGNFQHF